LSTSYNTYSNDKPFYPEHIGRVCYDCGHFLSDYSRSDYRYSCEALGCPCILTKGKWSDTIFIQLDIIFNSFVEIDTKDGNGIIGYALYLDNDDSLIAKFYDTTIASILRYTLIAKATRLGRSNPYLVPGLDLKRKKEDVG